MCAYDYDYIGHLETFREDLAHILGAIRVPAPRSLQRLQGMADLAGQGGQEGRGGQEGQEGQEGQGGQEGQEKEVPAPRDMISLAELEEEDYAVVNDYVFQAYFTITYDK